MIEGHGRPGDYKPAWQLNQPVATIVPKIEACSRLGEVPCNIM